MKRSFVTLMSMVTVLIGYWVGGFDFGERGGTAVMVYLSSIIAGIIVYAYPGWPDGD